MAAVDAQFFWMSAKIPNDQFLLYAFDGQPADLDAALHRTCQRAWACPELNMRVDDGCGWTYPRWVPAAAHRGQILRHELADASWQGCLAAVVTLADHQLDLREIPWQLHVFTPVYGIAGVDGPGTVAVLQVPHALGDGARASAMAAWLFGREAGVPRVRRRSGFLPTRAIAAAHAHRQLVRDIHAGVLAPGVGARPLLAINSRPEGVRSVRTLVRRRSELPGPTVTVGALAAVSTALWRLLGAGAETLGAEVPMAKSGVPEAHNHFGNVAVGLYPRLNFAERVQRITADLADGRRRMAHRAARCGDRAFAAVPAPLLRWGVGKFDPGVRPTQVAGNTVVSSVNRGAADLRLDDAPVVLTAGFPALSPVMGLTHGVHGIGDTVAISVHSAASAVSDIDTYIDLLDAALNEC